MSDEETLCKEYNDIARRLETELNDAGTLIVFSVDDYDEHRRQFRLQPENIKALEEYTGEDIGESDILEMIDDWLNLFAVRWHIRINGNKLAGLSLINRDIIEDTPDYSSWVIKGVMDTIAYMIEHPESVKGFQSLQSL